MSAKAGVRFTILEAELAESVGRTRDWTIGLHWALPLLKRLLPGDLSARLNETKSDPSHQNGEDETIYLYNSQTGERLKEVSGPGMLRISRRKLRALCRSDIPVIFGKTLTTVTYNKSDAAVTAHFADGSTYSGDIVIGADGPRSKVRELLLGVEESRTTPLSVVQNSAIVCYDDAEKAKHVRSASPTFAVGYHPDRMLHYISSKSPLPRLPSLTRKLTTTQPAQDIPDPLRPETWTFQLGTSQLGRPEDYGTDSASRLAAIKKAALNVAEPFRSANLWIPEGTNTWRDHNSYWLPIPWDNHSGSMTLAGDAAHPMPPRKPSFSHFSQKPPNPKAQTNPK